ncbi:MAG: hypothetical protein IBJ12_05665 [Sphingomonadaceae bacterium]|nr:hypothetical protein [Sphingomonadaceae bacterium]
MEGVSADLTVLGILGERLFDVDGAFRMITALFLAPAIVSAGPSTAVEPATGWQCQYTAADGSSFKLSGFFPEFPKGSPANIAKLSQIDGNAPEFLRGRKPVKSYEPKNGDRFYQVSFADANGDRYNLNFQFSETKEMPTDITHWISKEQKLVTMASGKCSADFNPEHKSE